MLTSEMREALTRARELIKSGEERYICIALINVGDHYPELRLACGQLRAYLGEQLAPSLGLLAWQFRSRMLQGNEQNVDKKLRQDRLAWIDWLLDEPKE